MRCSCSFECVCERGRRPLNHPLTNTVHSLDCPVRLRSVTLPRLRNYGARAGLWHVPGPRRRCRGGAQVDGLGVRHARRRVRRRRWPRACVRAAVSADVPRSQHCHNTHRREAKHAAAALNAAAKKVREIDARRRSLRCASVAAHAAGTHAARTRMLHVIVAGLSTGAAATAGGAGRGGRERALSCVRSRFARRSFGAERRATRLQLVHG